MTKYLRFLAAALALFSILVFTGCGDDDDDDDTAAPTGRISIDFVHYADGATLDYDTLKYTNAAGNQYLVYQIQYFISKLIVYKDGVGTTMNGWKNAHYVDTDIASTLTWDVFDQLQPGTYDSLTFVFGFTDADNQSFMYVNPPENGMVWPEMLGGGYHYMKLDGKWLENGYLRGFNFHMGRGQDNSGGFIDNSFGLSFHTPFTIIEGQRTELTLQMNIEEWFQNPHTYDHNQYGGDIMQNQEAMNKAAENGSTVFQLSVQ